MHVYPFLFPVLFNFLPSNAARCVLYAPGFLPSAFVRLDMTQIQVRKWIKHMVLRAIVLIYAQLPLSFLNGRSRQNLHLNSP